jgi:hypothetical protein
MEKSNLLSGSIKDKFMDLPKPPKKDKDKNKNHLKKKILMGQVVAMGQVARLNRHYHRVIWKTAMTAY